MTYDYDPIPLIENVGVKMDSWPKFKQINYVHLASKRF